ncbi:Na+/H+ antiporter [Methylobacterium brachythecii]|uniref:CPA1 family monovalent cation:H+ antiporter n=1 Tax=Methylobacterium brachythecii TaxID=1176177 RepID=A0A7W6AI46_9HYPH|nr:Na+/H+ antiporter [Methylobacterium brachythecii]MBB3901604.1 CPA1 family monovalent cation:H+ antiporter [Methylobacterium brachythecii]GLS44038.1 Na+/H+ antiporter [Methylobacterium brachythecii]
MTPVALLELVLVLVGLAVVLSLAAARLRLPPAVALVIGGMALALVPHLPAVQLDPDLIMVLFLPPLLQSSAWFTVWRDFKAELRPILMLSVGAVAFTTFAVGVVAHLVMPSLPWGACFALGAIVSPPDAVAAKAVLEHLTLPRRLTTILEGESLVNDASGLVLYRFAVAAALTGAFSAVEAGASFLWLAVGGIGIGVLIGLVMNWLFRRITDGLILIVLTFLVAWASYILAERVHASGVLAVVACGLMMGSREHELLGAQVRMQAVAVWGFVVYVLEALVFVLIGLALRGVLERMSEGEVFREALPLALAVSAVVVISRFVWVFPATYLPRWLSRSLRERDPSPPLAMPIIVGWAGMRGVVSLAAALALPLEFPGRDAVLLASFAVILFTVLVQGLTLGPLIKLLKLEAASGAAAEPLDLVGARVVVAQAGLDALEATRVAGSDELLHPKLTEEYRKRVRAVTWTRDAGIGRLADRDAHFEAALLAHRAGRDALIKLHRENQIHVSVLRSLESELDLEELRLKRLATVGVGGH